MHNRRLPPTVGKSSANCSQNSFAVAHWLKRSISARQFDDAASVPSATGAARVEFVFVIAVSICFGMDDESASVVCSAPLEHVGQEAISLASSFRLVVLGIRRRRPADYAKNPLCRRCWQDLDLQSAYFTAY